MRTLILLLSFLLLSSAAIAGPVKIGIEKDNRITFNGQPFMPLGVSPGPPTDFKTPDGKDGWKELADGGINYFRCGPSGTTWDKQTEARVAKEVAAAEKAGGIGAWLFLRELCSVDDKHPQREADLRRIVNQYKNSAGVYFWKSADEPAWGKVPIGPLERGYKIVKELDPDRPVLLLHAPRNTIEEVKAYNNTGDIFGADIYPVSVPMGKNSHLPNKNLSVVGDYTKRMVGIVDDAKPIIMVLQVTWRTMMIGLASSTIPPTFEQQRYMMYQAFIDGARGAHWFGFPLALSDKDKPYGWNWTYWYDILKPLLSEVKKGTELNKVLTAPKDDLKLQIEGADDLEYLARKVDGKVYILAAKREKPEAAVRICGLGINGKADVMFENRAVDVKDGVISDSFKPNAVHIYRIGK